MALQFARPVKRKDSSSIYFRQRIPLDVIDKARGSTLTVKLGDRTVSRPISSRANEVKLSLNTADSKLAKERQAQVLADIEAHWSYLRAGGDEAAVQSLSKKQCVALSGEIFKAFVSALEEDPGTTEAWDKILAFNAEAEDGTYGRAALLIPGPYRDRTSMEERYGDFVSGYLKHNRLRVDRATQHQLLIEFARALTDAAELLRRRSQGDYGPSKVAERFPDWTAPESPTTTTPVSTLSGLMEAWWKEAELAGRTESTKDAYSRAFSYLSAFLEHNDASRVTAEDIHAYKDHRLNVPNPATGKVASPRTIKDGDLAAFKTVFGWAVRNGRLTSNPAAGVTILSTTPTRTRSQHFSRAERTALLQAARDYQKPPREQPKLAAAKRWVPWICAYTGARVGEVG